jgi:hypothetical protein
MPLLMTSFLKIQYQLLWNSLKHPFNITWLKKSSMLTFLVFVMQAFGSCEIYNFMWSFSLFIVCYKQGGKLMYVCLQRFQFAEIKIGKPMKCFSPKVVMFGKCLAYQPTSSMHNLPRKYWSCQGWHFQVDVTKNMHMCTKMKQLGAEMQDQETIVLRLFLNSMNYFKHFKAPTSINYFYYFSNDMQKNIDHNLLI